ncbi:type I-E CRISPR-associated protein Cas6/Cse3/CasE [Marinobacter fonticola]|uniref:type I-E CRISPR-associated protein Cas6/Cse3/CasE n=1 Tax=Marinobacter fonticola TaxID=2603215 RepID=UPI0011E6E9D9|nr:type I-E CRISPR-associated protein Cas6/Cse3/CasE [Marinobacter fonticola]
MFLSRVQVATEGLDRQALLSLLAGNAYSNHQLLWRLFPASPERSFLFRQELEQEQLGAEHSPRGLPLFYVLSTELPEGVPGLLSVESKPFAPQLVRGQRLRFRLRANPTVARKPEGGGRSVRHDVLMDAKTHCKKQSVAKDQMGRHMDEAAVEWLESRSSTGGFSLDANPQVSGYRQHVLRRKGREIRFSSVDYEGILTVIDPDQFNATLREGLGRSKAFGCGLLMVRRV